MVLADALKKSKEATKNRPELKGNEAAMFLRFYDREKPFVDDFIKSLQTKYPTIRRYTIEPLTQSMNPIIPAKDNWEANLYFDTVRELMDFKEDPVAFELYQKASTAIQDAKAEVRTGDQLAFQV